MPGVSSDMIDDLSVEYMTPPALCSTPISTRGFSEEIHAPSYSPISFLCSTHESSRNEESSPAQPAAWRGFIIVGDNIDKTIKPRHETLQSRNRSLHYFNSYVIFHTLPRTTQSQIYFHMMPPTCFRLWPNWTT